MNGRQQQFRVVFDCIIKVLPVTPNVVPIGTVQDAVVENDRQNSPEDGCRYPNAHEGDRLKHTRNVQFHARPHGGHHDDEEGARIRDMQDTDNQESDQLTD